MLIIITITNGHASAKNQKAERSAQKNARDILFIFSPPKTVWVFFLTQRNIHTISHPIDNIRIRFKPGTTTVFFLLGVWCGIYRWILSFYERVSLPLCVMFVRRCRRFFTRKFEYSPICHGWHSVSPQMLAISMMAPWYRCTAKICGAAFNEGTKDITMHKKSICRNDSGMYVIQLGLFKYRYCFGAHTENTLNYIDRTYVPKMYAIATPPPPPPSLPSIAITSEPFGTLSCMTKNHFHMA